MTDVQYSDDGQWFWDEAGQQWLPVDGQSGGSSSSGGSGGMSVNPIAVNQSLTLVPPAHRGDVLGGEHRHADQQVCR